VVFARGIFRRQISTFDESLLYPEALSLDPISTMTLMAQDATFMATNQFNGSHDSIGYQLFSTFSEGVWWNREASLAAYIQAMSMYPNQAVIQPNAYLWNYVSAYFDIPLYASQYHFYDDTIPFLPYVLRGMMDLYAPFVNLYANPVEQKLLLLDYGLFPSYVITDAPTTDLKFSQANRFYSTTFHQWEQDIVATQRELAIALNRFRDASIINRRVISTGVVQIVYSNGYSIYVNYSETNYVAGTLLVEANSYAIEVTP
jgi:hypothetical protein